MAGRCVVAVFGSQPRVGEIALNLKFCQELADYHVETLVLVGFLMRGDMSVSPRTRMIKFCDKNATKSNLCTIFRLKTTVFRQMRPRFSPQRRFLEKIEPFGDRKSYTSSILWHFSVDFSSRPDFKGQNIRFRQRMARYEGRLTVPVSGESQETENRAWQIWY